MENKSLKEDDFGQGFKESILTLYKKQLWTDATFIIDLPKDRDNQVSSLKRVGFASSKKRHKKHEPLRFFSFEIRKLHVLLKLVMFTLRRAEDNVATFQEQKAESFKAHKIILASRSPVFKAMFFGPNASKSDTVHIKESDEKSVEGFLL